MPRKKKTDDSSQTENPEAPTTSTSNGDTPEPHCPQCGARLVDGEAHECVPDGPPPEIPEDAQVDLSVDKPKVKCDGNHGAPACGDPECWQLEEHARPPHQRAPLFDEPTFDPEQAFHAIKRKAEVVAVARSEYETAKSEAKDAKERLDRESKELEDLIRELTWKENRALAAEKQPRLKDVVSDAVERMGAVSTPIDLPEPAVEGPAAGEGVSGDVVPPDDAAAHEQAPA